jgi:hypothetical protein
MTIGDLLTRQDPYAGVPRRYPHAATDGTRESAVHAVHAEDDENDENDGVPRDPRARDGRRFGEALPAQVRFPGLLLTSHVVLRCAMGGAVGGLAVGAAGVALRRGVEHGLVGGAGRLGFAGMLGGAALGLAATVGKAATDPTMDADGIAERARKLLFNSEQARLDKWALGGCLIGSMAGFQAKPPLSAARCVPWFAAGGVAAWWVTSELERSRLANKRRQQQAEASSS